MNKGQLWDELKEYLVKAVPSLCQQAEHRSVDSFEELRLKAKATGLKLVLEKMKEYERSLLDK